MNKETTSIIITPDLLAKYLAGEALPAEAMAIDSWANENAIHKQEFESLLHTWDQSSKQPYLPAEKDDAWQEIQPQLNNQKNVRFSWIKPAIAASLFVCISLAAIYFFTKKEDTVQSLTFTATTFQQHLKLPDSTEITASEGSSLLYPISFTGKERSVQLKGEAYFDVAHDVTKPFIINSKDVEIKVLGTAFNIEGSDTFVTTTVYRGKVMMYNTSGSIIIPAGQTGIYNRRNKVFSLLPAADRNNMSYVSMCFYFENETLEKIVHYLSKAYHQQFILDDPSLKSLRLSSTFENESLEYILDVISTTLNVHFTRENNAIHVTKP